MSTARRTYSRIPRTAGLADANQRRMGADMRSLSGSNASRRVAAMMKRACGLYQSFCAVLMSINSLSVSRPNYELIHIQFLQNLISHIVKIAAGQAFLSFFYRYQETMFLQEERLFYLQLVVLTVFYHKATKNRPKYA